MRRTGPWQVPLLATLSFACGSALTTSPSASPREVPTVEVDESGGVSVLALTRPTGEALWLSLWVDAGSRDADPPSVATVAALSATDEHIEARTLLDATELSIRCERTALSACLGRLARAVAGRTVTPQAFREYRTRRQRALGDPRRRADGLALASLLGERVDPLGADELPTPRDVIDYLEAHYGRDRLLLVAVGELSTEELRAAADDAFSGLPAAGRPRATRPPVARAFQVEVGEAEVAAVATVRPSLGDALAFGHQLTARVADVTADVFPSRSGAIVLARGSRLEPLVEAFQLLEEERSSTHRPPPPTSPWELARAHGVAWATAADPRGSGFGLGVLVRGGRGDLLQHPDPDGDRRAAASQRIRALLDETSPLPGEPDAPPPSSGTNAHRLRVRRVPGSSDVAVALRFAGGSSEESPDVHGVTELVARSAERGCPGVASRILGASLPTLGIRVERLVDRDGWGLLVSGPGELWAEISLLTLRCAVDTREAHMAPARAELIARAAERPLRSALPTLLSPSSPGRIASSGDVRGLSRLTRTRVERWRRPRIARGRLHLAVAGDLPAQAERRFERLIRGLPSGTAPSRAPYRPGTVDLRSLHRAEGTAALIGWVTESGGAAQTALARFAAQVGSRLERAPGVRLRWSDGGADEEIAWIAVGLELTESSVEQLPQLARDAVRNASAPAEPETPEARDDVRAAATMRNLARALVSSPPSSGAPATRRAVARLRDATPRFAIAQPTVGHR